MSKKENNSHAVLYTELELSKFLGISEGRIRKLVADGVLIRAYRGKYDLGICTKQYIEYLQKISRKRERVLPEEQADKAEQEARLVKLRGDEIQLKIDIRQDTVIYKEVFCDFLSRALGNLRAKLLVLPSRFAAQCFGAKTQVEMQQIAKSIIYEVLKEIAVPDFSNDYLQNRTGE